MVRYTRARGTVFAAVYNSNGNRFFPDIDNAVADLAHFVEMLGPLSTCKTLPKIRNNFTYLTSRSHWARTSSVVSGEPLFIHSIHRKLKRVTRAWGNDTCFSGTPIF
jgi:hypothetical protein